MSPETDSRRSTPLKLHPATQQEVDIDKETQKNARRKGILVKYTVLVFLAYSITQVATVIAYFSGISSVRPHEIMLVSALTLGSTAIFGMLIRFKMTVTSRFANFVFFGQFAVWLVMYTVWFLTLREIRVVALFSCMMALSFLQSTSRLTQSVLITVAATIIQIAGSYYAINELKQPGSFGLELFYTFCFLPCALFISHLSEQYGRQRSALRDAKRTAEQSRDALGAETDKAHQLNKELQEALTVIREISIRDALTGLHNRRHLMEMLTIAKKRADRSGHMFSLAMLDIDNFKRINDQFGHLQGDEVLKAVSIIVQDALRGGDLCARYGGEEFVVVLDVTDDAGALAFAERARQVVESARFRGLGEDYRVTVSVGVTSYQPIEDTAHTIDRADGALYKAKHAGRNRVEVAVTPRGRQSPTT